MRLFVMILLFAAIGCANSPGDECGGKVLLLWPTAAGEFKFQEIQLSTLKSPYELKGSAAEVFYQGRLSDRGYEGPIARPNLVRSKGGVCVPADTASSMSLTTYAHIERLYQFDQKLGVDQQLSWPRKVGVDIRLFSDRGISHSNAHYFGRSDAMAVVPYGADGLPLALNPGILAHEHFHAHFQSQVLNKIGDNMLDFRGVPATAENLNKSVLRSWNEGLADFYGAIYTRQSDFFSASMPRLGPERDLAIFPRRLKDAKVFVDDALSLDPQRNDVIKTSYSEGSNLARMLYRIAMSGSVEPEVMLKQVLDRLKDVASLASPLIQKEVISFEKIIPPLLEGLTLNPKACAAVKATVSDEMMTRSFSQCGP